MPKIKWTKEMFLKGVNDVMATTSSVTQPSGSLDNLPNQAVIDRLMALREQLPPAMPAIER